MEHVFNQFAAFHRSWHRSGANETPVAEDTGESRQISGDRKTRILLLRVGGFAKMTVRRLKL